MQGVIERPKTVPADAPAPKQVYDEEIDELASDSGLQPLIAVINLL